MSDHPCLERSKVSDEERHQILKDIEHDGHKAIERGVMTHEQLSHALGAIDKHFQEHNDAVTYQGHRVIGVKSLVPEAELRRKSLPELHSLREEYLNRIYNASKGVRNVPAYAWSEKHHGKFDDIFRSPGNFSPVVELHHHRQHVGFNEDGSYNLLRDGEGKDKGGAPKLRTPVIEHGMYMELPGLAHRGSLYAALHPVAKVNNSEELRGKIEEHRQDFLDRGGDSNKFDKFKSQDTLTLGVGEAERDRHNKWRDGYWRARHGEFVNQLDKRIASLEKSQDIKKGSDQYESARRSGRHAIENTLERAVKKYESAALKPAELLKGANLPSGNTKEIEKKINAVRESLAKNRVTVN